MSDLTNIVFECTQCPNNDPTFDMPIPMTNATFKPCNSTNQCENNEYFDGSSCVSCGDNCAACMGDTCGFCAKDYAMNIKADGTRECVPREDGCPANHFVNGMNICEECDSSCDGCWHRGPEQCSACSDPSHVLRPTQLLRVDKVNHEMEAAFKMGMTGYQLEYDATDEIPLHGECVAECTLEGFALWNDNKVCKLCEPAGCSKCDASGVCEE